MCKFRWINYRDCKSSLSKLFYLPPPTSIISPRSISLEYIDDPSRNCASPFSYHSSSTSAQTLRGRSLSPNNVVVGNSGIPFSSKMVQELDVRLKQAANTLPPNRPPPPPRVNSGRISNYSHLSATPYRYRSYTRH